MKAEVKITITRSYDIDPEKEKELFGPDATHESILAQEVRFAEELPHEFMDAEGVEWKTEGRLLPDEV